MSGDGLLVRVRARLLVVLVLVGVGLVACRSRGGAERAARPPGEGAGVPAVAPGGDRPFQEGTSKMRERARALVVEVPDASMERRLEISRQVTSFGEPGVLVLIESLESPDPAVRSFSAWTLGYANDLRALPGLRRATSDPVKLVSLEAAASRVRLGDDGGFVRLVEGLEDPDPRIRARCIGLLESRVGDTLDFLPDDPPSERAAAVERWHVFLRQRGLGS